jgi:hypothetical protein
MIPQSKSNSDDERTEELPAQEKVASGVETSPALSAEQAYAQRFAEAPLNGDVYTQGFVP